MRPVVANKRKTDLGQRLHGGYTLIELLVSITLGSVVVGGVATQYSLMVSESHDQQVRINTHLQAQATLQMIGSEIRMLGNGVPFEQANFQIGDIRLSDPTVSEPIDIATATSNHIRFRINEIGENFLLTQDFNPATQTTLYLTDVSTLEENDPIYLNNSVVAGDDGLYGIVESVSETAKSVSLKAGAIYPADALFPMGTLLEEVSLVTWDSPSDGSGITRDSGYGAVQLGAGSSFELTYLDPLGNTLALPLTNISVVGELRAVRITINQQSSNNLKDGSKYTATITQTFGIRNLNYQY